MVQSTETSVTAKIVLFELLVPRDKIDEVWTPLVRVAKRRRRLRRDHEDGPHGMDFAVGGLTLGHLKGRDTTTPANMSTIKGFSSRIKKLPKVE